MPEVKIKKSKKSEKSHSPARFGGGAPSESAHSLERNAVGAGLKAASKSSAISKRDYRNNKLKHKPLNKGQDDDKYEYYTSEDEQGRRIQKMRKKGTKKKATNTKDNTSRSRDAPGSRQNRLNTS